MKIDTYIARITKGTGLSEKEIQDLVDEKIAEVRGLISKERALFLIAKELGVDIIEENYMKREKKAKTINKQRMKEEIFYLIECMDQGLHRDEIMSYIKISERDLTDILRELELESRIYQFEENAYNSFSINKEFIIDAISSYTGLSKNEIIDLVNFKQEEMKNSEKKIISQDMALLKVRQELIGKDVFRKSSKIEKRLKKHIKAKILKKKKEEKVRKKKQKREEKNKKKKEFKIDLDKLSDAKPPLDNLSKINKLTTGSELFDALLGGGLESGSIYEIFADTGAGKSQLSQQLSVSIQLSYEKGGLKGNSLYLDNGGTFRTERIIEMAEALDLDHKTVLKNIIFARVYNSDHLIQLVKESVNLINEKNIKILIIDALIAHFISEYVRKFRPAKKKLKLLLSLLRKLAKEYNLIVFFTYSLYYLEYVKLGDPFKPTGGIFLAHKDHTRIYFKKETDNKRKAHLIHSPYLPVGGVPFHITDEGIRD